jgi:hypothetical protein
LTSETFRSALVSSVLNKPYIKTAQNPIVLKIIALLQVLGFFRKKNCPPRYNWNIVESGVKYNNPNPIKIIVKFICEKSVLLY